MPRDEERSYWPRSDRDRAAVMAVAGTARSYGGLGRDQIGVWLTARYAETVAVAVLMPCSLGIERGNN